MTVWLFLLVGTQVQELVLIACLPRGCPISFQTQRWVTVGIHFCRVDGNDVGVECIRLVCVQANIGNPFSLHFMLAQAIVPTRPWRWSGQRPSGHWWPWTWCRRCCPEPAWAWISNGGLERRTPRRMIWQMSGSVSLTRSCRLRCHCKVWIPSFRHWWQSTMSLRRQSSQQKPSVHLTRLPRARSLISHLGNNLDCWQASGFHGLLSGTPFSWHLLKRGLGDVCALAWVQNALDDGWTGWMVVLTVGTFGTCKAVTRIHNHSKVTDRPLNGARRNHLVKKS